MYHGMMWSWTGWFGGIFMILLSVVILVVVLIAIRRLMESGGRTGPASRPGRETALDILKKRYARGEISREQFESMRRDIES
jgi:putative membrane protein